MAIAREAQELEAGATRDADRVVGVGPPGGVSLAGGMSVPDGVDLPAGASLPAGLPFPAGVPFPAGLPPVPAGPGEPVETDGHLRRCTFRRLDPVRPGGRGPALYYLATCLYGGPGAAQALGDLAAAQRVCAACRAPGVFRPDEA